MTMVPAPKLSKPLHFFYGGCGGGGVMTRLSDECSAGSGYGGGYNITTSSVNNNTPNGAGVKVDDNSMLRSDDPSNNDTMGEEEQSRTSNTSVNDDHDEGDQQQRAGASSSASIKGGDDSTDHQDSCSNWLELSLGGSHMKSSYEQQQQHQAQARMGGGGGGGDGLILELNLRSDGGRTDQMIHHQTLEPMDPPPLPQHPLDFGSTSFFGGGAGKSSATIFLSPPPHPIFPLIHSHPLPHLQHPQLSQDFQQQPLIGWGHGQYGNQIIRTSYSASSLSPSSSSSMPPPLHPSVHAHAQASFLTRPFTSSGSSLDVMLTDTDTDFKLIHPPPRRPHSGIWFTLQASLHQSKEPFLPQVSKRFLRIKDGRMTIRLVMKYLANKLGLNSESEVEIRCRGQQLVPFLTLQHVRDNIWSPREGAVTLLPDSSTSNHLMILNYGRSCSPSSSTYLATISSPLPNFDAS